MALAVDKFDLLFSEIIKTAANVKEAFAILGILYASRRTIGLSWCLYKAIRTYGIAKLCKTDLKSRYGGSWAGRWFSAIF